MNRPIEKSYCTIVFWLMIAGFCNQVFAQVIEGPVARFPGGPWMVKVYFPNPDVVQSIANWHEPRMVDFESGTLVLDVDIEGANRLVALGCFLELDEPRTESMWRAKQGFDSLGSAGIPGFPCYRTVDETFAMAQAWVNDFPNLVAWVDIGDSWEKTQNVANGDDIMVAVLTHKSTTGPKPKLFVMASVHAREYTPAALAADFGQYLLNGYATDPDATWLLDEHEIHLVLQANPDGRRRAETGLSWRKNTNNDFCGGGNSRGIDLNRNFPFQWACCGGSSTNPCSNTFRGPDAASESEVQAIRDYVRSIFPDQRGPNISDPAPDDATGIFFDIHSFSQLVIWPYGFNSTPTPNGPALQTLGRKLAFFNNYFPERASVSFTTDGTTDDFAYGDLGVAAYTFELGTTFFQPCHDYQTKIMPDNLAALIYAAKVVRTPYLTPSGPEVTSLTTAKAGVVAGDMVTIQASFDDSRFSQINGAEPVNNIAGAEVYVGLPPWRGGVSQAMVAEDGNFDQVLENGSVLLDTTGLTEGRHTLFVRAKDDQDQWGAFSALFLYVLNPSTAAHLTGVLVNEPSGIGLSGTIQAGPFQGQSDGSDGSFDLLLLPNTYDVQAQALGHAANIQTGVVTMASQTTKVVFQLMSQCSEFSDDVEMGTNGWTSEGNWAISNEIAQSGDFAWSDSPGGNFGTNLNVSLTSPQVDLSGYSGTQIRFQHRFHLPDSDDRGFVEYSTDGSSWTQILVFTGNQADWQLVNFEVPAFANASAAQIRFRLQTDFFTSGDGWHVDDIAFIGTGTGCYPSIFLDLLPKWPESGSVLNLMMLIQP